ncbi:hypothetical protein COO91_01970 [Nostoc flagelliforme CCNUN1]|uniref:Uncharacterized protein n=1 Tax=Nostoc flagelliforme CCNUN1 TaxID=2038116 RepID=A0A2K8SKW1_9NOSO|nr:hypothetical protein [Nostoc flagelliforme]AUB36071.1 hypothetical protein COO91_01970 [Nostoc flagelliforme CCNUN1]
MISKQSIIVKNYGKGYTAELKSDSTRWGCGETIEAAIGSLVRSHWQLFLSEEVVPAVEPVVQDPEAIAKEVLSPVGNESISLCWQGLVGKTYVFAHLPEGTPYQCWAITTPDLPGGHGRGIYLVLIDGKWQPIPPVVKSCYVPYAGFHLVWADGKWQVLNA